MKSILNGIIVGIFLAILFAPLTVHAETRQERWLRIQRESNEEYMKELEKDGNLTEEAEKALSWGKKTNKANKKEVKENKNNTTTSGKGLIYGTDELHVIGTPTDERGYTKAGDYGNIN